LKKKTQQRRRRAVATTAVLEKVKTPVGWLNPWIVVVACFLGQIMFTIDRAILPPLFPLVGKDLKIDMIQLGALQTGFLIGVVCMPFLAGALADRFGRKGLLVIGLAVFAVGTMMTGFATGYADTMVWRVVTGIGEGIWQPVVLALVGTLFPVARRARVIGIVQSGYPFGAFLGTSLAGLVAGATGSWRAPFYISGITSFVVLIVVILLVGESREQAGVAQKAGGPKPVQPWELFGNRNLVILVVIYVLIAFMSYLNQTWMPTYLSVDRGFGIPTASLIFAIAGLAGGVGMFLSGFIIERVGQKQILGISVILTGITIMAYMWMPEPITITIVAAIIGIIAAGGIPALLTLITGSVSKRDAAAALGLGVNVSTLGGMVSPVLAGAIAQGSNLGVGMAWPIWIAAILAVLLVFAVRVQPPEEKPNLAPESSH
jgi:ACS family hexuronate transporter-like MFS transporter